MKKSNKTAPRFQEITSLILIGDEGVDKTFIFRYFDIDEEELNQEINIYVKPKQQQQQTVQIYDFPVDKMLRSSMELYFNILKDPSYILYFVKGDSTEKDIRGWIQVIYRTNTNAKILFISNASTYLERERIIVRLGKQFETSILQNICFVQLQPHAFDRAIVNIDHMGMRVCFANCLKPTLLEKIGEYLRSTFGKIKKNIKNTFKKGQYTSVV